MKGLKLSRKLGQVICIGNNVTVTVARLTENNVELVVNAPKHVIVDKLEVRERRIQSTEEQLNLDFQNGEL